MTRLREVFFLIGLVALALGLAGCQPSVSNTPSAFVLPDPDQALVTLYLETSGSSMADLSLTLSGVDVLHDGVWIPLSQGTFQVDSRKMKDHQLLLGTSLLPAGQHDQFRLHLNEVRVGRQEPSVKKQADLVSVSVEAPVFLEGGDSRCLFLQWELGDSTDVQGNVPRFQMKDQAQPLTSELLYVMCDEIETLYLVRSDKNLVVYSLPLDGPVTDMKLDAEKQFLYILSQGARSLLVYDCKRNRMIDRIALAVTVEPHYFDLSADGAFAFISDAATDKIVKVDLVGGQLLQQVNVGYRPGRILYYEYGGTGHVAVSSPDSQQVFLLDAESLQVGASLAAGFDPEGLFAMGESLFVCDRGSQTVTAYSLRSRSVQANISVGRDPVSLVSDGGDKIYVANYGEQFLSVISAGQNVTLRRIPVGQGPFSFAFLNYRKMLYIANRKNLTITALDLAGEKTVATVPLGGKPLFIAVQD